MNQPSTSFPEALRRAVQATIGGHTGQVQAWLRDTPGAWGFLAGDAVLGCRRNLGRSLSDLERRAVWDALWRALSATRHATPTDGDPR